MSHVVLYTLVGVGPLTLGLYAFIVHAHLLCKMLAINVMGSGVFLILVALAARSQDASPDPVPQAMVITGIAVAVSATALALILILKVNGVTGKNELPDRDRD